MSLFVFIVFVYPRLQASVLSLSHPVLPRLMSPEWQFLLDTVVRWLPYIAVIIFIPVLVAMSRCIFRGSCRNGPIQKFDSQADEEMFKWMEGGNGSRIRKAEILKTSKLLTKSLPNLSDNISDDIFKSISLTRDPSGIATVQNVSENALEIDPGLCSLCHKVYSELTAINNLPCSHHFHQECAEEWFGKRGYCPKCIQPSSVSVFNA